MNRKGLQILAIFVILVLALVFYLWTENLRAQEGKASTAQENAEMLQKSVQIAEQTPYFKDNASLYNYDPLEVTCMYVTVLEGDAADGTNHTFDEVNSYLNTQDILDAQKILAKAIVKVGDETGPLPEMLGYNAKGANATINVRGRSSTAYDQKSYKLKLFETAGSWNGQTTIALNKHPIDSSRIRNALYYRLMQEIPSLVSLRTYFVHLYVCDATSSGAGDGAYQDFGLYTAVEQPNNGFLKNHGLTKNGSLYKAFMCEMYRYEDTIKLSTDPDYDEVLFSRILEPKDTTDHAPLIEMLEAVNDYTIPITETIDKYFDIDNLTDYLAFNLLMFNADSNAQNYYLYSPPNDDKWYYICWDGDGCLFYSENHASGRQWEAGSWNEGVSNYWSVVLFNRMLRITEYRDLLTKKVEEYHKIITPEKVKALVDQYRTVSDRFTSVYPDRQYLLVTQEQKVKNYDYIVQDIDLAYDTFMESLNEPMPFYINDVEYEDDKLHLSWGASYDFDAEIITYTIQVSQDYTFEKSNLIFEKETILTETNMPVLPEGRYYIRVWATNSSGYSQAAFDQAEVGHDTYMDGGRIFIIDSEGEVTNLE